jgi:DNA-binding NtrC family response regulator
METTKSFKIFILDDDAFCRGIYEQHLKNLGFAETTSFDDCNDCLNQLTEQPDIIFLDNLTGPSNGIEALKTIKCFNPNIYVVIMSAQEDIQVAVRAQKYGAFGYIIKGEKDVEMITSILKKIKNVREILESFKPKKFNKFLLYLNLF